MQRARGYGALKADLQLLAEEEGLHLAEIARQMKITPLTAGKCLRALMEVDLIVEREIGAYIEPKICIAARIEE